MPVLQNYTCVMTTTPDVVAMLRELVTLTTLDEESPQSFKVRAYENALLGIEGYGKDITELSVAELTKIKGVGKATATKIRELVENGSVAKIETLRAAYPPAFVELSKIPGLGPKTLKLVRAELGVEDLDGLKAAIAAEQLRTLPRMGPTSEAKIAKAIDRLGLTGKDRRTPVAVARPLADRLVAEIGLVDGVTDIAFCGSLRRMSETVGDIDITVASTKPADVMAAVVNHGAVSEVILSGETKTSFLTADGLQVDVRVVDPDQFGAATLYFTGSKAHNIALRQRAIDRGLLLNEYGLMEAPADDSDRTDSDDEATSSGTTRATPSQIRSSWRALPRPRSMPRSISTSSRLHARGDRRSGSRRRGVAARSRATHRHPRRPALPHRPLGRRPSPARRHGEGGCRSRL